MTRGRLLLVVLPLLGAGALVLSRALAGTDAPASGAAGSESRDIARGETLYHENCAACHGADLEGQPDWRSPGPDGRLPAPPHDDSGHTWHHADSVLFDYTKLGGAAALARQGVDINSGMPGFGDVLTDAEIRDVLAFIKSTWSPRAREVQSKRSTAAAASSKGE